MVKKKMLENDTILFIFILFFSLNEKKKKRQKQQHDSNCMHFMCVTFNLHGYALIMFVFDKIE